MALWEQNLREIFDARPAPSAWEELCKVLNRLRSPDSIARAIDLADEGLASWPDHLRLAPARWICSLETPNPNPRLALVRAVRFSWHLGIEVTWRNIKQLLERMEPFTFTHLEFNYNTIGVRGVRALARSPLLRHVRALNLASSFEQGVRALEALAASPFAENLIHLDLSETGLTDEGFEIVLSAPWFPRLTTFRARGHYSDWSPNGRGLTTASIEGLCALDGVALQHLDLQCNRINDEGVALLARWEHTGRLASLALSDNLTTNAARDALLTSPLTAHLAQRDAYIFPDYDDLDVDRPLREPPALTSPPELLSNLRDLLSRPPTEDNWWTLLSLFDAYEPTSHWQVALDYAVEHLSAWPDRLRIIDGPIALSLVEAHADPRLGLARTVDFAIYEELDGRALETFQKNWDRFQLYGLKLSGSAITPLRDFFKNTRLHGIRRLDLGGCFREGITLLRALANGDWLEGLVELDLSNVGLTPRGLRTVGQSPALSAVERLDLNYNSSLGFEGMEVIAEHFGALRELHVSGSDIYDVGVAHLASAANLSSLRVLDVSYNGLSEHGLEALATSAHLHNLEELHLHQNAFGDSGVVALVKSTNWQKLETLHLEDTESGDEAVQAILAADLPALRSLNLSYSMMKGETLRALRGASFARSLVSLTLVGCLIEAEGASHIANAPLDALEHLDLSESNLDDPAGLALAQSPHLSNLEHLDLSFNDLSDETCAAIIDALPRLRSAVLWGTEASTLTLEAVQRAARFDPELIDELVDQSSEFVGTDYW